MLSANVKSTNNDVIFDCQLGMIQQVLKIIELPLAFVSGIVNDWQFIVIKGYLVPTEFASIILSVDIRERILTSVQ